MRRLLRVLVWCTLLCGLVDAAEITKGPLAPGQNLPGTFHPYNVTARVVVKEEPDADEKKAKRPEYTTRGKYHCLITEYDLDPVVMLVARGLEGNAAFRDLVQKLDGILERNQAMRLRAFVVFLHDDLNHVAREDERRTELANTIARLAEDLKLRHVVLTLAGKPDLARYPIGDAPLTAILYRQLRIAASHTVSREQLEKPDMPEVKAILSAVASKLKATR